MTDLDGFFICIHENSFVKTALFSVQNESENDVVFTKKPYFFYIIHKYAQFQTHYLVKMHNKAYT